MKVNELRVAVKNFSKQFFLLPFGQISIASFLLAVVSGIFLAIIFDIKNPYDSITLILLSNPAASLFRSIHYWSAQIFIISLVFHITDHFIRKTEKKLSNGVWLRVTISIFFLFFVMISGFIIKGDADAEQASRILRSLFEQIPFTGKLMADSLLGKEGDYQLVYVHHIATATIILWVIAVEHSKVFWAEVKIFIYTLFSISVFAFLFVPLPHDGKNPVIKGPWYFVGLQEILHWVAQTQLVIFFAVILFILFYLLKNLRENLSYLVKKFFFVLTVAYVLLTIIAYYFRGENWEFIMPWKNSAEIVLNFQPITTFAELDNKKIFEADLKQILGRREGCVVCHQIEGLSKSHDPNSIGCFSCHLGNPFTLTKNAAHKGLILIPGNLSDAKFTCGSSQCHPDIIPRINTSIMSTMSGVVSVNRFVFEESNSPSVQSHVKLLGFSDADSHLRNLCTSCHLGNHKIELGAINELSRGGGCNACHLNYSSEAREELLLYLQSDNKEKYLPKFHPDLSLQILNDHCFGCHSRSGRISTNYEGWFETLLNDNEIKGFSHSVPILSGSESVSQKLKQDLPESGQFQLNTDKPKYRILMDGRVFQKAEEDVHHKAGMECIDCHIAQEVMGDGNLYKHKEEQVKIQCTDCHSNQIKSVSYDELDYESRKIIDIRKSFKSDAKFISTQNGNLALTNSYITKNGFRYLITKDKKDSLTIKPPAFICTEGKSHQRLSCNSCHTQWVSYCVGCHTTYNQNEEGFDLLDNKDIIGSWMETPSDFYVDYPVLGIKKDKSGKEIIDTFIPGMIIKLENLKTDKNKKIFKRLFAPTFSHTINKDGRSCKSCHINSLTLGYGKGKLSYKIVNKPINKPSSSKELGLSSNGKWSFEPQFSNNKEDNLPKDAWIGSLKTRNETSTTRTYTRPFTVEEQKRILLVGTCLTCHQENSKVMKESLLDFEKVLNRISDRCVVPF